MEWQIFREKRDLLFGMEMGKPNQCFFNAKKLVRDPVWAGMGLRYAEGIMVLRDGRFCPHGWVVDQLGSVLEVTPLESGLGCSFYVGTVLDFVPSPGRWGVDPVEMFKCVVPLLRPYLCEQEIERSLDYFGYGAVPQGKGWFIK